jgi:hypothetical protein
VAAAVAHGATHLVGLEPARFGLRTRHIAWAALLLSAVIVHGARGLGRARTLLLMGGLATPFLTGIALTWWYGHTVAFESRYLLWALPGAALLLARGALSLGPRLGGLVLVLAIGAAVVTLFRPPPSLGDPIQLRYGPVRAVMQCYREDDLVVVSSLQEARLFVGFGGHPTRLRVAPPPPAESARRWVVVGPGVCAAGIAGSTCGLSLCPPTH